MNENQQDLLEQFIQFSNNQNITLSKKDYLLGGDECTMYSIPYNSNVAKFMANMTGIDITFIKQFTFAHQFLYFLKDDFSFDIKVCLVIDNDTLHFEFKKVHNGFHEIDFHPFLIIQILPNSSFLYSSNKFELKNSNDYELAYIEVLKDIKLKTLPYMNFNSLLKIHAKSKTSFIQDRLKDTGFKAISCEDFVSLYKIDSAAIIDDGANSLSIGISSKTSDHFLDNYFPKNASGVVKSIISLSCFFEKFFNKNINWSSSVRSDITIMFENISKYEEINQIYSIHFGVMSKYDCRCSLFIFDDGSICFHTGTSEMNNFDEIYEYLKEEFIEKIEGYLDIDRSEITLKHLHICQMMII